MSDLLISPVKRVSARRRCVAQIPVGRLDRPEGVARAVIFLASGAADFIAGSTLTVTSGQYMM